jgi:hypothetical protein
VHVAGCDFHSTSSNNTVFSASHLLHYAALHQ